MLFKKKKGATVTNSDAYYAAKARRNAMRLAASKAELGERHVPHPANAGRKLHKPLADTSSGKRLICGSAGDATQGPLYACIACYQDQTMPANKLRAYEGACWCSDCFADEYTDDNVLWDDLPAFVPLIQYPAIHAPGGAV